MYGEFVPHAVDFPAEWRLWQGRFFGICSHGCAYFYYVKIKFMETIYGNDRIDIVI